MSFVSVIFGTRKLEFERFVAIIGLHSAELIFYHRSEIHLSLCLIRTLAAADNAVMLVDAGKGLEPQTRKLFEVSTGLTILH